MIASSRWWPQWEVYRERAWIRAWCDSPDWRFEDLEIEARFPRHLGVRGLLSALPPFVLLQVVLKIDVIYEKDMLYLYVLSGIGGLLLLLLIFLALYKVRASRRMGMLRDGNGRAREENGKAREHQHLEGSQPTPSFYR